MKELLATECNRMRRISRNAGVCLLALAAVVMLAGCTGSMGDLQQWVAQVKARKGGRIEPIPQIKPFETYAYNDENLRSPFVPPVSQQANANSLRPDANRVKQYLEQFPLDSLKMMGTLDIVGIEYALIRDSDGIVHRVKRGDYLGQNNGKIMQISDSGIKLQEIIPDGLGGWTQREAELPLSE